MSIRNGKNVNNKYIILVQLGLITSLEVIPFTMDVFYHLGVKSFLSFEWLFLWEAIVFQSQHFVFK